MWRNVFTLIFLSQPVFAHSTLTCSQNIQLLAEDEEGISEFDFLTAYRRLLTLAEPLLTTEGWEQMLQSQCFFRLPGSLSSTRSSLSEGLAQLEEFARINGVLERFKPHLAIELSQRIGVRKTEEGVAEVHHEKEKESHPLVKKVIVSGGPFVKHNLAFSPDPRLAIDQHLHVDIVDPRQGVLFTLGGKRQQSNFVRFSPDGKYLIRETLHWTDVFDVHAQSFLYSLPERHPVFFRPHASQLVEFTETEIRLRDIPSGEIIQRTKLFPKIRPKFGINHRNEKTQATVDPSGRYVLFYPPGRRYVYVWDIDSWELHGKVAYTRDADASYRGPRIGFSATGEFFYVGVTRLNQVNLIQVNLEISLWETKTKRGIDTVEGVEIVFSQNDDWYAVSREVPSFEYTRVRTVSIFPLKGNGREFSFSRSGSALSASLAFSPDQKYFFVSSIYKDTMSLFRIYDLVSTDRMVQFKAPYGIENIIPSLDSRFVVLLMDRGNFLVYSVVEKKIMVSSTVLPRAISNIDGWVVSEDRQFAAFKAPYSGFSYVLNLGKLFLELGSSP